MNSYVYVHAPKRVPRYLRDVAAFTAPDPWHENRLTAWSVSEYVWVEAGSLADTIDPKKLESKRYGRQFTLRPASDDAPRSLPDSLLGRILEDQMGATQPARSLRFLPDSLLTLWKSKQISTEALPRLLFGLQPLGRFDLGLRAIVRFLSWLVWIFRSVTALSLSLFLGGMSGGVDGVTGQLILTVVLLSLFEVARAVMMRRWRKQVRWIIEHR